MILGDGAPGSTTPIAQVRALYVASLRAAHSEPPFPLLPLQCVVGLTEPSTPTAVPALAGVTPPTQASCTLRATADSAVPHAVKGQVSFTTNPSGGVFVSFDVSGLPTAGSTVQSSHHVAVHRWGDVRQSSVGAIGPMFEGGCTSCRPVGLAQAVGLLFDGNPISATSGAASGMLTDSVATLEGSSSIVGHALAVHATDDSASAVVAHCVIGAAQTAAAVPCTYTAWRPSAVCACDAAGTCSRTHDRDQAAPPRNGGAACSTFTEQLSCAGAESTPAGAQVSVRATVDGLTAADTRSVAAGAKLQTAIAQALSVDAADIINVRVTSTSAADTAAVLTFVAVSSDAAATAAAAATAFSSPGTTFLDALVSEGVPVAARSVSSSSVSTKHGDSGLSTGAKAGIVVACLVGAALLGAGVVLLCKRKERGVHSHRLPTSAPQQAYPHEKLNPDVGSVRVVQTPSGRVDVTNPLR